MSTVDRTWRNMQIAERIVEYLFVNGQGEQAERLKLISPDGKYLGGWCRRAVIDCIVRELDTKLALIEEGAK